VIRYLKLDENTWALECAVLKHLAEVWNHPDDGIWERRGEGRHYVFSKVMTWVAFDRAIKSAESYGFKAPLPCWRVLRDSIWRDVCEKGFDSELNCFVEAARREPAALAFGWVLAGIGCPHPRHHRGDREAHDA
jgi:GH15 family glucan-1,4-alpha-glucosidase